MVRLYPFRRRHHDGNGRQTFPATGNLQIQRPQNNADAIYSHSKTYSTMETQQQINELQSRQLELRAIMASSDERAAKCFKNGTSFRETYPDDFARYEAANTEYNRNEQTLAKLEATRDAERAEEEQAHNIDAV